MSKKQKQKVRGKDYNLVSISVDEEANRRALNLLFSSYSPCTIVRLLNQKWMPLGYRFVCLKDDDE
jgi:hypothetical protein